MATDYRALHNQYAQGMAQPSTVQQSSAPGFNFLQGWSASPTAGYLPPKAPTQAPIQYGKPTTGGWIGGADGQPIGGGGGQGNAWMNNGRDPREMLHDGIRGNFASWRDGQSSGAGDPRGMLSDGQGGNFLDWQNAYKPSGQGGALSQFMPQGNMQANFGMQQPNPMANKPGFDAFGNPIQTTNPGRDPNIWGGP